MAVILILAGVGVWYFWAVDVQKGNEDFRYKRMVHDHIVVGCIPYLIAFVLIGAGLILAFKD